MTRQRFKIYKAHGGLENFSKKKLYSSLKHSGLSNQQSELITAKVSSAVNSGASTKDIYRKTLQLVKQNSPLAATHYSLKRAIFELGPTGFHFETFVARYFKEIGHVTKTCQTFSGRWVKHEVDVVAIKNGKRIFVECKFHNRSGIKTDIKTALYVKSRWEDLKEGKEGKNLDGYYLATNTAFTLDAITYAQGTGLKLLGVNAPADKSFLDQIKALHLYPITSLRRLNKLMRNELLAQDIILAKEIPNNINLLFQMGMKENEINQLLHEIQTLKGIH